jgi:gentisate 1,2-dioxygenase
MRTQFHRVVRGAETAPRRETGSSVYQVFDGSGTVTVGDTRWSVTRGDLFVVPSWQPVSFVSEAGGTDSDSGALDLFQFGDAPVFEKLNLYRSQEDAR